jgi:hypothetical protein
MSVRIVKCFHAQVINVSAQCDSNKICFCGMSKMFSQITKISREFFPTWTAIVYRIFSRKYVVVMQGEVLVPSLCQGIGNAKAYGCPSGEIFRAKT